jgi:hypothetical protein
VRRVAGFAVLLSALLVGQALAGQILGETPPAGAADTAAPGLLGQTDLPARFQPVVPASTITPSVLVTDAEACTQTLQPVAGALDGSLVQFTPGGATNALPSVTELVVRYSDAAAAAASFAQRRASHAARLRCGTVTLLSAVTAGSPASSTASIEYRKVATRFGGIGRSWFAERSAAAGSTIPYTSVTFRSGPYVVGLTFSAGQGALGARTLRTLATRAARRLTAPIAGP